MSRFYMLIIALVTLVGCTNKSSKNHEPETPASDKRGLPLPPLPIPAFNGPRAFDYLLKQVSFGPRNPNSRGHVECRAYLTATLNGYADNVQVQEFSHTGYAGERLHLANIIASFNPESRSRLLLCAHWDTRPRADRDVDRNRRNEPIIGANDGASGVAVLLELASLMKSVRPPIGVDIVLFDGEDYGLEGDHDQYLLGSRYFARNKPPDYVPRFAILLDMVGDKFLEISREQHSVSYAPDIVDIVWRTARELGFPQFINDLGEGILDDHIALNEAGIKAINIIDLNYPDDTNRYWHTHQDTPENCSPESLEVVGRVITQIVYSQRP